MSAPMRVQVEADEATQDQFDVMPSPPENEPGDEIPNAVPERAEQPTPADSDVTMETPRVFPDQLSSQPSEMDPGAGQENEHASAVPLVARTLKRPPEIWDLVQETPVQFNPGGAFVARLTSSKTKLILLTLAVLCISGLCAYAVITLRDGRNRGGASAQVQEERGTSETVPASQASVPATVPASAQNAPVNAPSNTSPGAGDGVANTPPQPTYPQTTDPRPTDPQGTNPQAGNPVTASNAPTDSTQPTGVPVGNISMEAVGAVAALSGDRRVRVGSGRQNADKPRPGRGESGTATGPDTSAKRQTSEALQAADLKRSSEKSSLDSASAKKRSDTTASPQVIAPPPATSTAPKAKVIQWP